MSNNDKQYNVTVTPMFQTQSGNFMSLNMTEERIVEIRDAIATLKEGDTLFLKRSKSPNNSGKYTYFLEIADPTKFQKKSEDL
jgi:hypothetical protein